MTRPSKIGTISFAQFKSSVLRFLDRCYPSTGICDAQAWERANQSTIWPDWQRYVVPEDRRRVVTRTLEERMACDDWAFASTPGGCESIEGGHSAVEALFLLGELGRLSGRNRRAWVDYFNQYQDRQTGYYLGPYVPPRDHPSWKQFRVATHPWEHMHDHLISCLCPTMMLLGGQSRYKLSEGSMTGRFLDRNCLESYLCGRDWNDYAGDGNYRRHNPWWMGNEFWYPACILWQISVWEAGTPAGRTARQLLDEVWYGWHDRNMGWTGFWYGDLEGDPAHWWHGSLASGAVPRRLDTKAELHWAAMQVMGGAHQLWFYDFDGHPIADEKRRAQTDILLAIQNRQHHHFGSGDVDNPAECWVNCTDVDCMTLLAYNYRRQDYRRAEIEHALHDGAVAILRDNINRDGVLESRLDQPFAHCFNSWETFSPPGWGNVLNQSFYAWTLSSAASVAGRSPSAAVESFLQYRWPQVPSHWLWMPVRASNHRSQSS